MSDARLRIGFIPLVDAATLLIAVDKRFTADEGLEVTLVEADPLVPGADVLIDMDGETPGRLPLVARVAPGGLVLHG